MDLVTANVTGRILLVVGLIAAFMLLALVFSSIGKRLGKTNVVEASPPKEEFIPEKSSVSDGVKAIQRDYLLNFRLHVAMNFLMHGRKANGSRYTNREALKAADRFLQDAGMTEEFLSDTVNNNVSNLPLQN